jgi:hypothetical protein
VKNRRWYFVWKSSTGQIYEIEFNNTVVEDSETEDLDRHEYDDWNNEYLQKFYRKLQSI